MCFFTLYSKSRGCILKVVSPMVHPTLSWDHQSSKCGLNTGKSRRNYVQNNRIHPGNVSEHIPDQFGAFWRDFPIGFPMIYKGISGFYCFWSQSESREVLYWFIRYPRSHFFRTKTPEMNVSESLHVVLKKLIEIEQKFMKLCPDRNSWKKKTFFSRIWQHWAQHL